MQKGSVSVGPIRFLVLQETTYCKAVGFAVAVGVVHLLLGAVNILAFLYSELSNDKHVVLCSAAYYFFSAEAIIGFSAFNGWSISLKPHHRTLAHVFLQLCALICASVGATMILYEKGMTQSVHAVSSIVTLSLGLLCLGTGPGSLVNPRYFSTLHVSLGIATMVVASLSFISGLFMPKFETNFSPSVKYILLAFVVFSTVVITVIGIRKCLSWF